MSEGEQNLNNSADNLVDGDIFQRDTVPDGSKSDEPVFWQDGIAEEFLTHEDIKPDKPGADEPATEPTEPTELIDGDEPSLPAHFESIPKERLARAKRTKRILIALIIVLVLILLGGIAGSIYYYQNSVQTPSTIEPPSVVIEADETIVQDRGTTEAIEMPRLVQMFGKTPQEIVATLGSNYIITKSDDITEEASAAEAEGDSPNTEAGGEGTASGTAENSPKATQVVTISYSPEKQTGSVGTTQVQNIYLTLDESGKTIEVYFVSSMNLLDYPIASFAELVASKNTFVKTMADAGATVAPDATYNPPTSEEFTEYVDKEATIKKVKKESMVWSGTLTSSQAPTRFEITFTYDFGASGVEDTPDKQPTQRMLYVKLG